MYNPQRYDWAKMRQELRTYTVHPLLGVWAEEQESRCVSVVHVATRADQRVHATEASGNSDHTKLFSHAKLPTGGQ
jgi:hypothetical protein